MPKLCGIISAAIAALTCLLSACTHQTQDVTIADVLQDWKTFRHNNTPQVDPNDPHVFDAREEIDYELQVMDSSADYLRLQEYVVENVRSFDFVIRLSERIDHIAPDSIYSIGNKIHAIYKPDAGSIRWIIGTGSQEVRIVQFNDGSRTGIHDTVISFDAKSLLEGLGTAPPHLHINSALPLTDLISIWTPDVKRHFGLCGFWVLGGGSWYEPHDKEQVPQGMWKLAEVIKPRRRQIGW